MKYEHIETNTKYIGTANGNPGLDVLGAEIDHDIFPKKDIDALIANEHNAQLSRSRRPERRTGRQKVQRVAALVGATLALGAGVVEFGKIAPDDQPPVTADQMYGMTPQQHLDRIHEEVGELPDK